MKGLWWKITAVVLLVYVHIGGMLLDVPRLNILNETIRALYFHVPMWFGMVFMYTISLFYAIKHLYSSSHGNELKSIDSYATKDLRSSSSDDDIKSVEYANIGTVLGILGMLTGMLWAQYAWGTFWHGDPKQTGAAIALLVYFAYFVLRGSLTNHEQRARLSAVYNIFAFAAMIPLVFIIPRMYSSMHPGNGGNPGFNAYDLDSRMRTIFYPAVIAWFLVGIWIANLRIRYRQAEEKILESEL